MSEEIKIDKVRASRAGHTFHERWAARRALQLIFPSDNLHAIAIEGIPKTEQASMSDEADDIADLILYYGDGDSFETCSKLETLQFKYKTTDTVATASYLKKTLQKFADTILDYERVCDSETVNDKVIFSFVTNSEFAPHLWDAISCLKTNTVPQEKKALAQFESLKSWCEERHVNANRLFSLTSFQANTEDLDSQNRTLRRTLSNWSSGVDAQARVRLYALCELVREKAGEQGQTNNLLKKEDILDALECEPEDLFPADTRFLKVEEIIERKALTDFSERLSVSQMPLFIYADGGVGKTVFIQSLASYLSEKYETVVFDCFGGGAYRSDDQARHLPKIGLIQIVNELASRGLCDPLLPTDSDRYGMIKSARRRFEQASATITEQSQKDGLLIIIDDADNAQLEAINRNEDAFPKLLLSSLSNEMIDGVKLVFTARPHRKDEVIGRSQVEEFPLAPFCLEETKAFLETRRRNLSEVEIATASARSRGNARVLEYLVESWDENVVQDQTNCEIKVEELIEQKCLKIFRDLHVLGWKDSEITEFFTAISLLPPPIPLNELAKALGWSVAQVNSAASDLAPMLEMVSHGAIFRDEPTETYIRETYSEENSAQQAIAERLQLAQSSSMYAADALPRFLVAIKDMERAFELAKSSVYPDSIQSDYGRRKLKLSRLYAAYNLAVSINNYDLLINITMQLAQVASANAKGDEYIRQSASLATKLGDRETSRRLYNDRSGWRGARNARLTVAYNFLDEHDEAKIHQSRTIGWINWHAEKPSDDNFRQYDGPDAGDYAAVIFSAIISGEWEVANRNLSRWSFQFGLSICNELVSLCEQKQIIDNVKILDDLASFASSKKCTSLALQVSLLSTAKTLSNIQLKRISRAASSIANKATKIDASDSHDRDKSHEGYITSAALTAVIVNSRQSSNRLLSLIKTKRPSSYRYNERHGPFRAWTPIIQTCLLAWTKGQKVTYFDLLPDDVPLDKEARKISDAASLLKFLQGLRVTNISRTKKEEVKNKFDHYEAQNIANSIEITLTLVKPLENLILESKQLDSITLNEFVDTWKPNLNPSAHWQSETGKDILCRSFGLRIAKLFFRFSDKISSSTCEKVLEIIDQNKYRIHTKLGVISPISRHDELHDILGKYAKTLAIEICKDESIEQRGDQFLKLASALLPMSISESREYYKQGLSQLDQMGGEDYDLVYSILHYAAEQQGGNMKPELGHRLMNLCQVIFHYEPSKFGWTLLGRATAQSVGLSAISKLIRWHDQDVVDYSNGLPQLVSFLTKRGALDGRRATVLLNLCEDHAWHEWHIGKGVTDILSGTSNVHHEKIFDITADRLFKEHVFGGYESTWESLSEVIPKFPNSGRASNYDQLKKLAKVAALKRQEDNKRRNHSNYERSDEAIAEQSKAEAEQKKIFLKVANSCIHTSSASIDDSLQKLQLNEKFSSRLDRRLINHLRDTCKYDDRLAFTLALTEATTLAFDDIIEAIIENMDVWAESTNHLVNNSKEILKSVFSQKGTQLFQLRYSGISRQIYLMGKFCRDTNFVKDLVLETIAKEQVQLDGDEWLQIANSLCTLASEKASVEALEGLLSEGMAKVADEIGDDSFQPAFGEDKEQGDLIAEVLWHLLGSEDAYERWKASKAIVHLVELELFEDLEKLFDLFDTEQIASLASPDTVLAFQNSQQWFLMGLSRATLSHADKLRFLRARLSELANREELHIIFKLHIARCLKNIALNGEQVAEANSIWKELVTPPFGYIEQQGWPQPTKAKTGFTFDRDFTKYSVHDLCDLFEISREEARDAVANEITQKWPLAKNMEYFSGRWRHKITRTDRYETYREHVQKHALLSAATTLYRSKPVVQKSYQGVDSNPWLEWLRSHDVTFADGSWLVDWKDQVPEEAKERLLGERENHKETLDDKDNLLVKIGLSPSNNEKMIPIFGHWKSSGSVYVRIETALTKKHGSIKSCTELSKRENHNLWLPMFNADGEDCRHRDKSQFEPFIWEPEFYPIGIDEGDKLACRGAMARPRLGLKISDDLQLDAVEKNRLWYDANGKLTLKSQAWGRWETDHDNYHQRNQYQNDGVILWASQDWLDTILENMGKRLAYHIAFTKHKPSRSHEDDTGLKAVYVGLRTDQKSLRIWHAKKASKAIY